MVSVPCPGGQFCHVSTILLAATITVVVVVAAAAASPSGSRLNMTGAVMRFRANTLLSRSPRGSADGWMGL
ncbi:hypothetical protein F5883DRAFT_149075 [Diaporthe sp. PMI_573]|nr:hypothetical protein F5883DRAFT_149075 [Diaporthaceae sp. PMI_573]